MFFYKKEAEGKIYKNPKLLSFDNHDIMFYDLTGISQKIYDESPGENHINGMPKTLVRLRPEFFHAIFDTFAIILQEFKKNPDTCFLINIEVPNYTLLFNNTYTAFIFKILNKKGVNYQLIHVRSDNTFLLDNFKYFALYPVMHESVLNVIEECKSFFSQNQATKKVYLSRKKVKTIRDDYNLFGSIEKSKFEFKDDKRIDDDTLENYFSSLGFDIVYPEDFICFEDQINFFSQVKTIVSCTGAGLTNLIFMPDKSKVVELVIPIVINEVESIHAHYHSISYAKKHNYIAIYNERNANEVIEKIESNKVLKEFICD